VGLLAVRRRWRRDTIDNFGGFQLIDRVTNGIVRGARFGMSAEDVIAYCAKE